MTEKFKIRKIEVSKKEKYDIEVLCDWCGEKIDYSEWLYELNNFILKWNVRDRKNGDDKIKKVDLCVKCREKLFEWLGSQGCAAQIIEDNRLTEEKYVVRSENGNIILREE
jgi:hypothetical protein